MCNRAQHSLQDLQGLIIKRKITLTRAGTGKGDRLP